MPSSFFSAGLQNRHGFVTVAVFVPNSSVSVTVRCANRWCRVL
jgi:hypothetical protein